MWELIQQNKRRSIVLFVLMGGILLLLGYLIGAVFAPPDGGMFGVVLAAIVWVVMSLISYFSGDSIMLNMAGAKEVTREVHPRLYNVVEEMKIAGSLPHMPKLYIIETPAPNAFATGRKPENASIAVTTGLLEKMSRDELQGVVAHETGHILNRDILFITFAGVMLGTAVILSDMFLRGMRYGGSRRLGSSRSKSNGQGAALTLIFALVFAILAPIMAQLLYFAVSRRREYLADATAVRLTRYPEGLASALEKISNSADDMPRINKAIAPLFIANPMKAAGTKMSNLTSTHPPITERIAILRSVAGGVGYLNYQQAFSRMKGSEQQLLPKSALEEENTLKQRTATPDDNANQKSVSSTRDINDLIRAVNGFVFLTCTCGLKIKIPPDFAKETVTCPRCNQINTLPVAELPASSATLEGIAPKETQSASKQESTYRRQTKGWESFKCSCGRAIQLSPAFAADTVRCSNCGTVTYINRASGSF